MGTTVTPAWVRGVDGAVDGAVLSFAAWTLFYELALATQWRLWWPARVWVVVAAALVLWRVVAGVRGGEEPASGVPGAPPATHRSDDARVGLVLLAVVVLVVLAALRPVLGHVPVLVAVLVVLVSGLVVTLRAGPVDRARLRTPPVPAGGHVLAGVVCLGLGLLAAAMWGSSGDDVYYVNRAVWVAEHGTPTLRDTMFSSGTLPSTYLALPLPSFEAWQGALAHVLGVAAPTFAFLWIAPVAGAAAGWAAWRLVRAWAPRRAPLVFVLATAVVLLSATSAIGRYSIGLTWEGKIPAVTTVLPLAWVTLTRLATAPRREDLVLLLALGTCLVGLTSSAPLLAVVVAVVGLVAGALLRSRPLALGAACLALAPVAAGVVQALASELTPDQPVVPADEAFDRLFTSGAPMVLLVVGVALGVRVLAGPARVLATGAALAAMLSLLPGMPELVDAVTGSGPVVWRLVYVVPTAVLVGMLGAVRAPSPLRSPWVQRLPGAVAAVVVLGVLVVQGTPLWAASTGTQLVLGRWAVDPASLERVRQVQHLRTPPGPWLLPQVAMSALAVTTTEHPAVVPRFAYLQTLRTSARDRADRELLVRMVNTHPVRAADVRGALQRLGVALACVPAENPRTVRVLTRAVRAPLQRHGDLACHAGTVGG